MVTTIPAYLSDDNPAVLILLLTCIYPLVYQVCFPNVAPQFEKSKWTKYKTNLKSNLRNMGDKCCSSAVELCQIW